MKSYIAALLIVVLSLSPIGLQAQDEAVPRSDAFTAAAADDVPEGDLSLFLLPLTATELEELAGLWQEHLKHVLEENVQLNLGLRDADEARSDALRKQIVSLTERQNRTIDLYENVVSAWENKGADPDALAAHRKYITSISRGIVQSTDPLALLTLAKDWVFSRDGGLGLLIRVALVLASIVGLYFLSRFVRRLAERAVKRVPTISRLLRAFILQVIFWVTFAIGVMMILAIVGINVTPLFAVFGGISFILGFALQETLGNLASGLMIMVLKPFDTGDYIQVGGSSGFVDEMSVVSTRIRTFDNQIIVVPNSKIWGDVITNVSASEERRVDLVFGIAYSDNAEQAIQVLNRLVKAHSLCLTEPEAEVFVGELGDSSVNIFCRPWVKSDDYWTVYWDLTGQAKEAFDQEGISIPFPQRDVHLIQEAPV